MAVTPAANQNGTATIKIMVSDGFATASDSFVLTVNAVNDSPVGANNSVTVPEDTAYTFAVADFGFSDPNDNPTNAFLAVKITTLPSAGNLTTNGITVNAGDFVSPATLAVGETWTPRESTRNWQSVASSSDGTKLVAVVQGGPIYTSADSGVTWTARESSRNWYSVASSSDGVKLAAVVAGGRIYTSTDSGVSWTARESGRNWLTVASSSDGSKLVGAVQGGQIYTSADSGVTWTARETNRLWHSVASSSDGSKLVAGVGDEGGAIGGQIYTSTDSGVTWTARESDRLWYSFGSSSDGTKLVAVVRGGQIYTSTDSGVTWSARENERGWWSVASSADGTKLAAVANGKIYTSTDSGVTWTSRASSRTWQAIASSADGSSLVAVVYSGQIYTSSAIAGLVFTPAANASGSPYATFTFQVQDDGGTANGGVNLDPSPNTMTIHVTPVNDTPTLTSVNVLTGAAEDTPFTITYAILAEAANEEDVDGDVISFRVEAVSSGTLTKNGTLVVVGSTLLGGGESLVWTPVANANGTLNAFTIRAFDGSLASSSAEQVLVSVTAVNDRPIANAGPNQSVSAGSGCTGGVTLNGYGSTDADGDLLSYEWTGPFGTAAGLTPVVHLPVGSHTIVLVVSDGHGGSSSDSVLITVVDTTPPVIALEGPNPLTLECGQTFADPGVTVTDNCDTSPTVSSDGSIDPDSPGDFLLTYTATDASGNAATATRTVTVVSRQPLIYTGEDLGANVASRPNAEAARSSFFAHLTTDVPTERFESFRHWAGLYYPPKPVSSDLGAAGTVTFNQGYVNEGSSGPRFPTSGTHFLNNVPLTGANAASIEFEIPVVGLGFYLTGTGSGSSQSADDFRISFYGADGTARTVKIPHTPHGGGTGSVIFFGYLAAEQPFTRVVLHNVSTFAGDSGGLDDVTVVAPVHVNQGASECPQNVGPAALADQYEIDEDFTLHVFDQGVLANDTDPEGNLMSADLVTSTVNGTIDLRPNGAFIYVPNPDFNGMDTFTYRATDGRAESEITTVSIQVNAMSDDAVPIEVPSVVHQGEDLGNFLTSRPNARSAELEFLSHLTSDVVTEGFETFQRWTGLYYGPIPVSSDFGLAGTVTFKQGYVETASSGPRFASSGTHFLNNVPLTGANATSIEFSGPVAAIGFYLTGTGSGSGIFADDFQVSFYNDDNLIRTVKINHTPHGGTISSIIYFGYIDVEKQFTKVVLSNLGQGGDSGGLDQVTVATIEQVFSNLPSNTAPVAVADDYASLEDEALLVTAPGLLGNDGDAEADTLAAILINGPANGTLTLNVDGSFTYTPHSDFVGQEIFTYNASDGEFESDPATVIINVLPVNDAPSFVNGGDQTVLEDAGGQMISGWVGSISTGPADEVNQVVTFSVSNDNSSLFLSQPAIASDGTLSYTPAANANGNATVTLSLTDNGGTANGGVETSANQTFTITVTAVNDAPSFAKGSDQTLLEDAGTQTVPDWAMSISAGPIDEASQTLSFQASNDNTPLFLSQPAIASDGTLSYTPAANANGIATVSVGLTDNGGTANGGVETSANQTFTITVTAVNDAPSGADGFVTTDEDTPYGFAAGDFGFSDSDDSPANQFAGVKITTVQSAGTLHVGEMEIHAGDFVMQAEITAGNLTFEPLKDANSTPYTSFTFQVQDDGGTADGGANLDATPNTVTINVTPINDPPVVAIDSVVDDVGRVIGVNDSVFVGQRIFLTGSFRDPDQPDSHTAGGEWRDGTTTDVGAVAPGQSIGAEHVFVSPSTIGSGFDVQLTVTDGYNTDGSAQRTVRVVVPATGVSDLADGLADLLNNGTLSPAAAQAVQDAIDQLIGNNGGSANNGATDQIDLGNFNAALVKIRAAIEALDAAKAADPSLDFTNEKRILALAGAAVADQAVSNAKNIASTPKDSQNIDAAKALVSQGRALIQSGNFLGSIDLFQDALTWLKSPPKKKASFSVNKLNLEILTISELAKTPLMQFRVSGPAGIQVHLEFSRDLQEWEPVQTIAVPYAGVTEFKIEREEGSLSGFYRLRRTNLNSQ